MRTALRLMRPASTFRIVCLMAVFFIFIITGCAPVGTQKKGPQISGPAKPGNWLGVNIQEMSPELAKTLNLQEPRGVFVLYVVENSPAKRAGIVRGDVITAFQGNAVNRPQELVSQVRSAPPGSNVGLTIIRKGRQITATASLAYKPEKELAKQTPHWKDAQAESLQGEIKKAADIAQAGKRRQAIELYTHILALTGPGSREEYIVQQRVVRLVKTLSPLPAIPKEAQRYAVRGQARIKTAQNTEQFVKAAEEYQKALRFAPWWIDGYYNMGLIQEQAGQYGSAIQNLNLFLLAKPQSPEAGKIQTKIYELEVAKEELDKILALAGKWPNNETVRIAGNQIRIFARRNPYGLSHEIVGTIKGRTVEGTVKITKYAYLRAYTSKDNICFQKISDSSTPIIKGVLDPDNKTIEITYIKPVYSFNVGESLMDIWCNYIKVINRTEDTLKFKRK